MDISDSNLQKIGCVIQNNEKKGVFITNLKSEPFYEINKINYFIDADVSIYLLSMLWVIRVGKLLDKEISPDCLGNRLENNEYSNDQLPTRAFKIYISQYEKWRDQAIEVGLSSLKSGNNIFLVALDIKECFYRIKISFAEINKIIKTQVDNEEERKLCLRLNYLLERIHNAYQDHIKTNHYLEITHGFSANKKITSLPIGLPSSSVLCNWELSKIDEDIKSKVNPLYYGRYVDDILIVFKASKSEMDQKSHSQKDRVINDLLINKYKIFNKYKNNNEFSFSKNGNLFVQGEKLVIHFYDSNHNYAGLTEFKRELEQRASEFRFLPTEDTKKDLSECAYDINYKGSINKLRSLIGVTENDNELKKYLGERIIEYRLCSNLEKDQNAIIDQIFKFFRGRNMFDFCRTWEKVFTFLLLNQSHSKYLFNFFKEAKQTVKKLSFKKSSEILAKLKQDTLFYLDLSLSIPIALLSNGLIEENGLNADFEKSKELNSRIQEYAKSFRESNLIRHNLVSWPLINFTDFSGNLLRFNINSLQKFKLSLVENKLIFSPRFIHFDEYQLFSYLELLINNDIENVKRVDTISQFKLNLTNQNLKDFNKYPQILNSFITKTEVLNQIIQDNANNPIFNILKIRENKPKSSDNEEEFKKEKFVIGVANTKVLETNIQASYNPSKQPNLSHERQSSLFNLLNEADKKPKCDLVVLPEVCIPYSWLPFMVNHARRNDIGLIFGLEHIVIGKLALNLVATILPFTNEYDYHNCFVSLRLKNHYSPHEIYDLEKYRLNPPTIQSHYERYIWRGLSFAVYNCYELSDIFHRSIFRSDLDLLIAIEWNKDTNYYSNILESCIRDIHCYMVQVNTSQYGDSRIAGPKKSEEMNILRITGGDNDVLIKGMIDINELRQFQLREYDPTDKRYKPTPAGFDRTKVLKRTRV